MSTLEERKVRALESIAESLAKLANPLMIAVGSPSAESQMASIVPLTRYNYEVLSRQQVDAQHETIVFPFSNPQNAGKNEGNW
jgi:hypothetical protein